MRLRAVSLQRVGAGKVEMGQGSDGLVLYDASPAEDLLKLGGSLVATTHREVCLPPYIDGIERRSKGGGVAWRSQLIRSRGLQNIDGLRRIVALKGELGFDRRKVDKLHDRIFGKLLSELVGQRLGLSVSSCSQRQSRSVLHIASGGEHQCGSGVLLSLF